MSKTVFITPVIGGRFYPAQTVRCLYCGFDQPMSIFKSKITEQGEIATFLEEEEEQHSSSCDRPKRETIKEARDKERAYSKQEPCYDTRCHPKGH